MTALTIAGLYRRDAPAPRKFSEGVTRLLSLPSSRKYWTSSTSERGGGRSTVFSLGRRETVQRGRRDWHVLAPGAMPAALPRRWGDKPSAARQSAWPLAKSSELAPSRSG